MSFIDKILGTSKIEGVGEKEKKILDSFQSKINNANNLIQIARKATTKEEVHRCINEIERLFAEFRESETAYGKRYENTITQKKNNLNVTYDDLKEYENKPFDLRKNFISDENFMAIELSGGNLEKSYGFLRQINDLLIPYKHLYEDTVFPNKINIEYTLNRKLPESHLRLIPYTATMRKSKYPLCLWLSNSGDYGTEYIYALYFDKEGNLGQGELSLHGIDGIGISYETKIRRNQDGFYILRISKTLYSPPYGTTTIYHCKDDTKKS